MPAKFTCPIVDLATAIETEGEGHDHWAWAALEADEHGRPVWVTAWSSFKYTLIESDEANGVMVVQYEGRSGGFLAQNLIPDAFREGKAFQVESSLGNFKGATALEEYEEARRVCGEWREVTGKSYKDWPGIEAAQEEIQFWESDRLAGLSPQAMRLHQQDGW